MKQYIEEAMALAYGLVTAPKSTLACVTKEQRLYEGWILWFLSTSLSVVSLCLQWERSGIWLLAGIYGGGAVMLLIEAALLHGTVRMLGGQGSWKGCLTGICFCGIPANIGTLAGTFAFILPESLVGLVVFFSGLWMLALVVMALQVNYAIGIGRSIAAVILPVVLLVGVFVLLCIYVVISVTSLFEPF